MLYIQLAIFIIAISAVIKSADWFLTAAESVGRFLRMPPFVMGVLLVGLGTSLPELATSTAAVIGGNNEVALGNVIGSNVANILVIIGVATLMMGTIRFRKELMDIDIPLLIATTLLFVIMAVDGTVSGAEAALLLIGCAGYLLYSLSHEDREEYQRGFVVLLKTMLSSKQHHATRTTGSRPGFWVWVTLIGSLVLLGVASHFAVASLLEIVAMIGIGTGVVSFFALAIGTSLPELVVSIKALRRGEGDLVVGNIIGSCMFNILLIAGLAGVITPQTLALPSGWWMLVGMAVAAGMLGLSLLTKRLQLWDGVVFLLLYAALSLQLL